MNLRDTPKKPRLHRPQLLALLALQEQDCSPIELDELLGGPRRGYAAITQLRGLTGRDAIQTCEADGAARYRLTGREAVAQLLAQVDPARLRQACADLEDHRRTDEAPPSPAVLLRRAIAHLKGTTPTKKINRQKKLVKK